HWERITSTEDIDTIVNEMNVDLTKINMLLNIAYPSNNLVDDPVNGSGGGMFYTPADGATPAKIQYIYFDDVINSYKYQNITGDIIDFIEANESKTLLVKNDQYQYYISEAYLIANNSM